MINILILAAGQSFADAPEGAYPLCLTEIGGAPLIERQIVACRSVADARLIVALSEPDMRRFALGEVISLLAPEARVTPTKETHGAACTALLSIGEIDTDDELLILNGNEFLDIDFDAVLSGFRSRRLDAGVIVFPSVHPRYSFVALDDDGFVVQATEKRPISRNATAGFYWFARGRDFVAAAQNMIRKDATVNGRFYICPSLNELVLKQARIGVHPIAAEKFHPLKNERQVAQFENFAEPRRQERAGVRA
jgi:NDP-sugar pyrophosphorylase family protein